MPRDPHRSSDFPIRPTTTRATERLWLNYNRLIEEHDQLCNRNLRLQLDVHRLSKTCGRYLDRIIAAE
ncbi:MAG: hypothetical protein L0099_03215, partial [Acidobacteria bacterium]|nr:hypothetical protein [Acidobacteriota bacterium]